MLCAQVGEGGVNRRNINELAEKRRNIVLVGNYDGKFRNLIITVALYSCMNI